jgi:hypothetical protein
MEGAIDETLRMGEISQLILILGFALIFKLLESMIKH